MADRFSTHHLELGDEVVIKRYNSWDRGEPHREWVALTLLAEHAPGLAPAPIEAALDADPPVITMSRLPGRVLRGERATGEQLAAIATALNLLHQIPAQVVAAIEPAPWGPVVAVDKVRALADKQPDLGQDPLVLKAFHATPTRGAKLLRSGSINEIGKLPVNVPPASGSTGETATNPGAISRFTRRLFFSLKGEMYS